jgi:flagellar basal-body rod protein FlgG
MRALSIAATGMAAQDLNVQIIANINTTSFKRGRVEFTDLIYQSERLPGVSSRGQNSTIPEGAQLGLGVRTAAIRKLHIQGTLANTGNQLDLALNGRGWFQITDANGRTLYTRAGSFNTNGNGQIVTTDGLVVSPAMTVPQNALSINVSQTGLVTAIVAGQTAPQQIGQLTLANFANDAGGRQPIRANRGIWPAGDGTAGDPGFGSVSQGYLESSNVDPVKEITDLISAQRAYEMNSKVIQAASEMSSTLFQGLK